MKQPYCPVSPEARAWLDYRWAWLRREFGLKRLREHHLVLPNAEFFPDPYHGTPDDVEKLLARVAGFMGVDVHTLELHYYEEQQSPYLSRTSGTAGLYRENDAGKFEIWLEVAQLNDLERMIATMAHELGHVLLLGQKRISHEAEDHEPLTDLITVYMGMGVFTGNSVMRENYWHSGNYSGWSIGKTGYLPMHEIGYAFAHYAIDREEPKPQWLRDLRLDVRKACEQSLKVLAAESSDDENIKAVPYPTRTTASSTTDDDESDDDSRLRCTYCSAAITTVQIDSPEWTAPSVCTDCQSSMEEADLETDSPEHLARMKRWDRIWLYSILGLLGFVFLCWILGGIR